MTTTKDKSPAELLAKKEFPETPPHAHGFVFTHLYQREGFAKGYAAGQGNRWISVDELKRRMNYPAAYSLPEGTVLAYRHRTKPHHSWHYGIYVENENKARDQFRVTECILIHWPNI